MTLPTGTLGPCEVVAVLGAGGMGRMYRALDARRERDIALKVLPPEVAGDEGARRRLMREARTAAKLSHPNICTVFDVGESGQQVRQSAGRA